MQKTNGTTLLILAVIIITQVFCTKNIKNNTNEPSTKKVNFKGKIIGITDGDTYKILYNNKSLTIRLAHIDCPEKRGGQPFGQAAKNQAATLCFGKMVQIIHQGFDRNKRIIAEVFLENNENINLKMVQTGFAWHFTKYSKNSQYTKAENEARRAKIGLWADASPIAPWLFRKK